MQAVHNPGRAVQRDGSHIPRGSDARHAHVLRPASQQVYLGILVTTFLAIGSLVNFIIQRPERRLSIYKTNCSIKLYLYLHPNSAKAEHEGWARALDFDLLSEESLEESLHELLDNPK